MSASLRRLTLVAHRGVHQRIGSLSFRSFQSKESFYMSPLPSSSDHATEMNSRNTAGRGMNEPRSAAKAASQPVTPDSPAGNSPQKSTTVEAARDISDAEPKATSQTAKATAGKGKGTRGTTGTGTGTGTATATPANSRAFSTPAAVNPTSSTSSSTTAYPPSKPIKQAKNEAKAVSEDTQENVRHAAKKTSNAASSSYQDTKEDMKHGLNKAVNKGKQSVRKVETELGAPEDDYANAPASTPSATPRTTTSTTPSSSSSSATTHPYTNSSYTNSTAEAAQSLKSSLTPSAETKAKLSNAAASVKGGASRLADTLKAAPAKMAEMKDHAAEKLSNFGERMEQKFDQFGEKLIKSGEEIEKRDKEAAEPIPDPMNRVSKTRTGRGREDDPFAGTGQPIAEYDAVDHLPNPKNKNDVLPGTSAKDSRKNTPITDSKERGQFPG